MTATKLFACWVILHAFLSFVDIFLNNFSKTNIFQEYHQCQTVWIQIRPDVLSGLIGVQTVCKGYQQTTKVATSGERIAAEKKSAIDLGTSMSSSALRKHMTLSTVCHTKTSSYSESQTGMTDSLYHST